MVAVPLEQMQLLDAYVVDTGQPRAFAYSAVEPSPGGRAQLCGRFAWQQP